jgi:hypothetical protein
LASFGRSRVAEPKFQCKGNFRPRGNAYPSFQFLHLRSYPNSALTYLHLGLLGKPSPITVNIGLKSTLTNELTIRSSSKLVRRSRKSFLDRAEELWQVAILTRPCTQKHKGPFMKHAFVGGSGGLRLRETRITVLVKPALRERGQRLCG